MSTLAKIVGVMVMATGLVVGIGLLLSLPVWLLWNWLMPDLFGIKEVTWLQALGLCILCGCLFKPSSNTGSKSE